MARAAAGKKSPRNESNTTSTTASSAKAGSKSAGKTSGADSWTEADIATAALQGWAMFEYIERGKFIWAIEEWGVRFINSEFARRFVAERAHVGDALAMKAVRLIYRSKAAVPTPRRKK